MRRNPAPVPYLQQALAIAKFDSGMYEVVETFSGTATEPLSRFTLGRMLRRPPEAQHPKSSAIHKLAGGLPHPGGSSNQLR
jgi:hypothetical protein